MYIELRAIADVPVKASIRKSEESLSRDRW